MSVHTEADDRRDSAREHVQKALNDLNAIVVLQCWGHDEYVESYRRRLREAHAKLIEIRDLLG